MISMIKELERRNYSEKTVKSYVYCVKHFLRWVQKPPRSVRKEDIKDFLYYLSKKGSSSSTLNLNLSAIKFYLEHVLKRKIRINIKHSKRPRKIVGFLTKDEVQRLLNSIKNEKYWLITALMYGAGLRVSEVLSLKSDHLNIPGGYGIVKGGKGNKDRFFKIADCLKVRLIRFIGYRKGYLFQGRHGKLTQRSVQEYLKKVKDKAEIKDLHPHMLRHSYGTHLAFDGVPLNKIQSNLGHKDSRTTLNYIHAAKTMENLISPLD